MEKHINLSKLFEFSDEWDISFDDVNDCLIIDNLYKNAQEINSWLKNQDYPLWKYIDPEYTDNTKEYLDCRLSVAWPYDHSIENMSRVLELCEKYFGRDKEDLDFLFRLFEFNCFKSLKKFANSKQHFPHLDDAFGIPDEWSTLNMITFLDQNGNGGTNIYDYNFPDNTEHENLLFDLSEEHKVSKKIDYKFNRSVLFRGNKWHGCFIDDYEHYTKNWRYSQVYFIK